MAKFRVPEPYQDGIGLIAGLPLAAIEALVVAFDHLPDLTNSRDLPGVLAKEYPYLEPDDVGKVVGTLTALRSVYTHSGIRDLSEFTKEILESLAEQDGEDRPSGLENRLDRLLAIEAVKLASKAIAIQHEHEHVFCTARIFTDIRPIFGDDARAPPGGGVLVHSLKISYHEGSRTRDLFVALDPDDIDTLRDLIVRAEIKAKTLRNLLSSASVPELG